jgi:acyl dehydratase
MMVGSRKAFEDFTIGDSVVFHCVTISKGDIIDFASAWDPQPMHLDEEAGRASILGDLTGSGWHMICILMRGMCDGFLIESTSQGAPGVDDVRWLKPLHPGDELSLRYTVLDARASKSRPGIGIVQFRFEMINQNDVMLMVLESPIMFARRQPAGAVEGEGA